MNRGAAHQQVFATRGDGELFESLLGEGCERFGIEVHAYCLMPNHFHLLLHCPHARLSEFMHLVTSTYSKRFNLRVGRDGPLFRARYLALPVATAEYLTTVGRYIHRNPIDVAPDRPLDRYRWSSYRYYTGLVAVPEWLHTDVLLSSFTDRSTYASFVDDPNASVPLDAASMRSMVELLVDEHVPDIGAAERRGAVSAITTLLDPSTPGDAARMARRRAAIRLAADPRLPHLLDRLNIWCQAPGVPARGQF